MFYPTMNNCSIPVTQLRHKLRQPLRDPTGPFGGLNRPCRSTCPELFGKPVPSPIEGIRIDSVKGSPLDDPTLFFMDSEMFFDQSPTSISGRVLLDGVDP